MKIFLTIAFAALASCSTVLVDAPLGRAPSEALKTSDWDGSWFAGDGRFRVDAQVQDHETLAIQVYVCKSETTGFELDPEMPAESSIEVRQMDGFYFLHLNQPNADAALQGLYFCLASIDDGQLSLWAPNAAFFADMIQREQLRGEVHKREYTLDVELQAPTDDEFELITGSNLSRAFLWEGPMCLVRLPEFMLSAASRQPDSK